MSALLSKNRLIVLLIILSESLMAQYQPRGEKFNYLDAEKFYATGNYHDALSLFEVLIKDYPKTVEYKLKAGICQLYLNNDSQKSIDYIKAVYDKKPKTENVLYYLAKAYALNYNFDLAIETFNQALSSSKTSANFKSEITHLIEQCNNGK